MQLDKDTAGDAVKRLRRIEGQVAGIVRMIESQRDCRDVVTQISAASSALDQVGFKVVAGALRQCLADEETAAADGSTAAEMERLFLKLA